MRLDGLWRYPVKSLCGEALGTAELTDDGIPGRPRRARPQRPRSADRAHPARPDPAGDDPDGVRGRRPPVGRAPAHALVTERPARGASPARHDGPERFDVLNLLVATDGATAVFGHDLRRLRPNLLISGVAAADEAAWPRHALAIGDALIGVQSVRQRCIVTSIDPDTGEQNLDVSRRIRRVLGNELALNCWVIRPGTVHVGDPVRLVPTDQRPDHLGGWIVGAPYRAAS